MPDKDGPPTDALTALVRQAASQPGASLRGLARLTIDPETGYKIGQTWLHELIHGNISRAPEPKFLRALAAGIGLPLARVQQAAAAQFLEYTATELSDLPEDAKVIVGHLAGMDPSELPQVRAVVEALLAKKGENSSNPEV
ncbi:hypothetical protein [Streptomyces rubellomurinus]|uniref:hypothetical protein n=1 Tax=Streptomyces rubellomurinus (strain ATCC 31215) TaxID=359131 RepID=UPI000698D602|nr:hypothetical protein [Streptomyces rubellomurinus]